MTGQERSSSLADRLQRGAAPGWRPEVGDAVIGTVVDIDEALSNFGEGVYPVITIARDDDSTEVAVHAFHTVLKHEVAKKRPQVGDRIGIKYLGVPQGKKYEAYRVLLERPVKVDYDRMELEAQAEMPDVPPGYGPDDVFEDEGF